MRLLVLLQRNVMFLHTDLVLRLAYLPTSGYLALAIDNRTLLYPVRISITTPAFINYILGVRSIFLLMSSRKTRPESPRFLNCFTSSIIMEGRWDELREREAKDLQETDCA